MKNKSVVFNYVKNMYYFCDSIQIVTNNKSLLVPR